ncbi:MAG TPA: TolC family protein [Ignavibacteriales bacterium]|nr:TolC family protein [Ignavibacteriales bacterium]HOL81204.1 TolC family protein [Ignavibacteriales bacterium]HOM65307.1 TolC family protein [Ignavibacteriales bacterium]HPD68105.1 TolC family protein [Ignavibacteriales bacterium]HPP33440.1 TolC family protein [Ignavibacteriales bacterium]
MKKILWIVLVASTLLPQKLTLEKAISIALQKNEKILQFNSKVKQKEATKSEFFGNYLPSLSLNASYTYLNDPLELSLLPIKDAIFAGTTIGTYGDPTSTYGSKIVSGIVSAGILPTDPRFQQTYAAAVGYLANPTEFEKKYGSTQANQIKTILSLGGINSNINKPLFDAILPDDMFNERFKEQLYPTVNLTLIQPIFTGFKVTAGYKAAVNDYNAALADEEKVKNEVTTQVVQNYLNVVLLSDVIKTRKNVLDGIKKHRDRAKRMFEEGLIANYNYLRAEVAVAEAEKNLSDDFNKLELAKNALKTSIGLDLNEEIAVDDSLILKQDNNIEFNKMLNAILENHPVLKMIFYKREMVNEKIRSEYANYFPTVALFGKYEVAQNYLSALEPKWAVGVTAQYNLFNGFKDKSKIETSEYLSQELQYLEAETKKMLSLAANKYYLELQNSLTKYAKLQPNLELAQENLRLANKRFEAGMGTSLEVVDAELLLEKNMIDQKVAIYEFYKSLVDLYNLMGTPQSFINIWNNKE